MENTGMYGKFEPMCKIRFMDEPVEGEEYIAITPSSLAELIAAEMKLCALESGGVDNWGWYGESISNYLDECRTSCYDQDKLRDYIFMNKSADETIEDFLDDMSIDDYAEFEVWCI